MPLRLELPHLLNARGLTGRGAEIGVFLGEFTEHLLEHWKGREVVAVDPWTAFTGSEYRDVLNSEQAEQDARYESTVRRLERFGARAQIWRSTGDEAAARIDDGSLDWVYLDAMHDRKSVESDLHTWWPKVRPGGILAGHDYIEGRRGPTEFGVRPAVDEFFGAKGIDVTATFLDQPFISWVVEVPAPARGRAVALTAQTGPALRAALLLMRRLTGRATA